MQCNRESGRKRSYSSTKRAACYVNRVINRWAKHAWLGGRSFSCGDRITIAAAIKPAARSENQLKVPMKACNIRDTDSMCSLLKTRSKRGSLVVAMKLREAGNYGRTMQKLSEGVEFEKGDLFKTAPGRNDYRLW